MMGKASAVQDRAPEAEAQVAVEGPVCQHHWIIATPHGATSPGRCKRCGEQREFRNSATDHLWEDESSSGYNAWRGVRSARSSSSEDDGGDAVSTASVGGKALMV